ncbi:MAG TPA: insulinase family protein [Acidobacteriota bacterium]|nr:insulinase family protein [Acidobacteriota bacterium]
MKRFCLTLLALSLFVPYLQAQRPRGEAPAWEHESSDIPVNPRIRFIDLENGMRLAWMANPEPDQRSYLRMRVSVGSLAEEDDELGMAHFLEHMAFNGTRNFPPGTLVEWFQEHGMAFGADSNASTGFEATVYQIDLPSSDGQSIEEGLRVLRDFADRIVLSAQEVEAEKGVIDAEQVERDSASLRTFVKQMQIELAGTRIPQRLPIGEKEVRARFSVDMIENFYRKWYRPENVTLVLVGDLEDLDPEPLMRQAFEDWKAPDGPPQEVPPVRQPTFEERYYNIYEQEIPTAQVSLEMLRPYEERPDTKAERLKDLPLSIARGMLNLRYSELAKRAGAPFLNASVGRSSAFEVIEGQSLTVIAAPDKWREGLAQAEQELRRAIRFGFQQPELEEVRANVLRSLDESVEREKTRASGGFVNSILSAAGNDVVVSDAETNRAILRPALDALTLQACNQAFSEAWEEGTLQLSLVGAVDLGEEAEQILRQALQESRQVEVEAPEAISVEAFAYQSDPEVKGAITERRHIEDLDIHQAAFANGVLVNIKKTDFKEKQILIQGRLGEGLLTLDKDRHPMSLVASQVFAASGLEAHSSDDLRRILAGKQTGFSFSVAQDYFGIGGSTTSEDLLLECELIAAYLQHPGWRPEGMNQFKAVVPRIYEGLRHQHQGPLQSQFIPGLYNNDPRFGLPPQEAVSQVSMDDLRAWLDPHLREAPLEVTFVGDLDVEAVLDAAARTLGRLPQRRPFRRYQDRRQAPAPKAGVTAEYQIETSVPKSLLYIAYPTTDGMETEVRRKLYFLSQVVDDRLRKEIREKLGAAYSPSASSQTNTVFPGVGLLAVQSMSDPEKVSELRQACLQVVAALAGQGTTQDEVDRLKQPLLKQIRDLKRSNSYWLSSIDESQSRPQVLDEVRNLEEFYQGLQAADLNPLASQYLPQERASWAVVSPQEAGGR